LRETFNGLIDKGPAGVTMTVELAGPASLLGVSEYYILAEEGIALTLPVKIKLGNPFLGEDCYIGSNSKPIIIEMTTGSTSPSPSNKSIMGSSGRLVTEEGDEIAILEGNVLVGGSFVVPQAQGCGGSSSSLVDTAIDTQLGLPSTAGHNIATFQGSLTAATTTAVRDHE
jgi:hypothetical protein